MNFNSLLISRRAQETVYLVNKESTPFVFQLDICSVAFDEKVFEISPIKGTIPSEGRLPINVIFTPSSEKKFNFNLVFNAKRKPAPITLNVKGEGYAIHETVMVESDEGKVSKNFKKILRKFLEFLINIFLVGINSIRSQFN